MQVIEVTFGMKIKLGLKNPELRSLNSVSFLLTAQLCPQHFLFKVSFSLASHLRLPRGRGERPLSAQRCFTSCNSPQFSYKTFPPLYLFSTSFLFSRIVLFFLKVFPRSALQIADLEAKPLWLLKRSAKIIPHVSQLCGNGNSQWLESI